MNTQRLAIFFLIALALGSTTVAVIPELREKAKALMTSEDRELLAKASGLLTPEGPQILVLKIKQDDQLYLEVYKSVESEQPTVLMAKIRLEEKTDAHFTYKGNATNLALGDMDGDGILEIFAPTFDDQMIARLNIFKFNKDSESFDRINSSQSENAKTVR